MTACRDHPRSRGVYVEVDDSLCCEVGSSPLARGLLGGQAPPPRLQGIIPARAGFTNSYPTPLFREWDHPRSRGVYRDMITEEDLPDGIIPARAGFTPTQRSHFR